MVFFHSYVSLPEGIVVLHRTNKKIVLLVQKCGIPQHEGAPKQYVSWFTTRLTIGFMLDQLPTDFPLLITNCRVLMPNLNSVHGYPSPFNVLGVCQ